MNRYKFETESVVVETVLTLAWAFVTLNNLGAERLKGRKALPL